MLKITLCPSCGSDRIKKIQKDWVGEFRGQGYKIPSLEFYECPECGEGIYDRNAMRKIQSISPAYDVKIGKAVA